MKSNYNKENIISKRVFISTLVLLLFIGTSSCNKIDELLTFDITTTSDIPIKKTLLVTTFFNIPTPAIKTSSESEFENNNTSVKLVKNIFLKELKLTITKPSGDTFSFLKDIKIYISTNDNNEIELASKYDINKDDTTIFLDATDARLDEYVKANEYNLRTEVTTRELIGEDMNIRADTKFTITANPF